MKLKLALILTLIMVGLHIYLTFHFYGLHFGMSAGESICNINSTFNCDTVTASPFSSAFGIPVALWGAVTSVALALLIIIWMLGWTENSNRLARYTLWLSTLVAAVSVMMGAVSTFMIGSYCLFCMGVYVLSFGIFALVFTSQPPDTTSAVQYIRDLFGPAKKYLLCIVAIPALSLFLNRLYIMNIGAEELDRIVRNSIVEWQARPVAALDTVTPTLEKGPSEAKVVVSEFADFRCGHCKHASPMLKAFSSSHSDVQLRFYTFPLDGACNPAIKSAGDSISCLLAKNVYCAEVVAKKGWQVHDRFFAIQETINANSSREYVQDEIAKILTEISIANESQKSCIENPDTDMAIRAQAKIGDESGVTGTPTLFVNGRKLNRGQLLPVLEAAYKKAKETE